MATFPFKTDADSQQFCESIASEMTRLFGIAEEEALLRICRFWAHLPEFVGSDDIIYHEDESYWANTIYFGGDSFWWITGEDRTRRKLPPLTPKPL